MLSAQFGNQVSSSYVAGRVQDEENRLARIGTAERAVDAIGPKSTEGMIVVENQDRVLRKKTALFNNTRNIAVHTVLDLLVGS